jgi:hypothetical protein
MLAILQTQVRSENKIRGLESNRLPPEHKLYRSAVCLMRYAPQSFRMLSKGKSVGEGEYVTRVTQVTEK